MDLSPRCTSPISLDVAKTSAQAQDPCKKRNWIHTVGKVSFEDWLMLTWSFGCTPLLPMGMPIISPARLAITWAWSDGLSGSSSNNYSSKYTSIAISISRIYLQSNFHLHLVSLSLSLSDVHCLWHLVWSTLFAKGYTKLSKGQEMSCPLLVNMTLFVNISNFLKWTSFEVWKLT